MKLHELHVAQLRARPPGERHAIATGPGRIGRFAVELSGAARGEDRTTGPYERLAVRWIPDERTSACPLVGDEIDRECLGPDFEILQLPRPLDHRPHHLAAGGVAEGVHDAMMAVASFAAQLQAAIVRVESSPPGDQFGDPRRSLAHHGIDHILMTEPATGGERVGNMIVEAVLRIDDAGDTPLRPLARRTLQVILRDHRHR